MGLCKYYFKLNKNSLIIALIFFIAALIMAVVPIMYLSSLVEKNIQTFNIFVFNTIKRVSLLLLIASFCAILFNVIRMYFGKFRRNAILFHGKSKYLRLLIIVNIVAILVMSTIFIAFLLIRAYFYQLLFDHIMGSFLYNLIDTGVVTIIYFFLMTDVILILIMLIKDYISFSENKYKNKFSKTIGLLKIVIMVVIKVAALLSIFLIYTMLFRDSTGVYMYKYVTPIFPYVAMLLGYIVVIMDSIKIYREKIYV